MVFTFSFSDRRQTARSALLQTVRAMCNLEANSEPPGRIKFLSSDNETENPSISPSRTSVDFEFHSGRLFLVSELAESGVASHEPKTKRLRFSLSNIFLICLSDIDAHQPNIEFNSSTSP